ncbi:hypothetical protein BO71DRAFT_147853 [Aspergillus ellipticus CBS 707.79]|uniref:Uncharacterized protein n=1 Tax=Aspergillus ellipticus CBS 707.79 TaxID=1448320 RepID=A0A319CUA4_9EURO|nr:hypothetical protein BO71DRAFT_147853 [Aspergillus ellipticus CBS 707.79]
MMLTLSAPTAEEPVPVFYMKRLSHTARPPLAAWPWRGSNYKKCTFGSLCQETCDFCAGGDKKDLLVGGFFLVISTGYSCCTSPTSTKPADGSWNIVCINDVKGACSYLMQMVHPVLDD